MARLGGPSTLRVVLLVLAVLAALLVVRFVVGLVVGLAKLALVLGVLAGAAYVGYRLWRGWSDAGAEASPRRR